MRITLITLLSLITLVTFAQDNYQNTLAAQLDNTYNHQNNDCNQIINGDFETDIANWEAYACTSVFHVGAMEINEIVAGQNPWDAGVFQVDKTITEGQTYTISFDANAAATRSIAVKSGLGIAPFSEYFFEEVNLTTQVQSFSLSFTMNNPTTTIGTLEFFVGTSSIPVFIDNVVLQLADCQEVIIIDNDNDGFNSDVDCDDNNVAINPDATEIANNDIDENCDGIILMIDNDNDGFNSDIDCDDNNAAINPNAAEIANNTIDENCDGIISMIDNDNDGFNSDVDCDDNNAAINPNATEIANNNIDEDCNGSDLITDNNNPVHPVTGVALSNTNCVTAVQQNATVCLEEWGMECQYLYDDCTGESVISPFIHVDQFGYRLADTKAAVLTDPVVGYNNFLSYTPSTTIEVRNAENDAVVFSAAPVPWNNGTTHEQSGDRGWWFDFSTVTTEGTYYIFDATNNQRSATFDIRENVYQEVLKHAGRMFYYNRSGIAKEAPFAESPWRDGIDLNNPGQYPSARSFFDQDNPATARDLSGGWWDAGDLNKYVTFTNNTLHNLMWAFLENPNAFTDDWNIPESGNGIPDILDEVKWELDWLLKMNNPDGSTIIKVGSLTFDVNESAPPSANTTEPLFYISECSSASIAVVSTFAQAATIFRNYPTMASYADLLEQRAITTWNYVLPLLNTNQLADDCDNGEVVAGDADWSTSLQRAVAVTGAIYLYDLTGDQSYHNYVINNIEDTENIENDGAWSPYGPQLAEARLLYTTLNNTDATTRNYILNSFRQEVEQDPGSIYGFETFDLYRADMPDWGYHSGSNLTKAGFGILNLLAAKSNISPNGNADFRLAAKEKLHYFHGVNPQGITYLSNMYDYGGDRCVDEIFHIWFQDDTEWDNLFTDQFGPPPGYLVGGANQTYEDYQGEQTPTPPGNQPIQKSYWSFNDFEFPSWALTEPGIYYQAAYIRLLADFTNVTNNDEVTRVNDFSTESSLKIFPNPTSRLLTIQQKKAAFNKELPIQVVDIWGRIVVDRKISLANNITLEIGHLSNGLYFLNVGGEVHRFILNKNFD